MQYARYRVGFTTELATADFYRVKTQLGLQMGGYYQRTPVRSFKDSIGGGTTTSVGAWGFAIGPSVARFLTHPSLQVRGSYKLIYQSLANAGLEFAPHKHIYSQNGRRTGFINQGWLQAFTLEANVLNKGQEMLFFRASWISELRSSIDYPTLQIGYTFNIFKRSETPKNPGTKPIAGE